jgi:hypothetical protein
MQRKTAQGDAIFHDITLALPLKNFGKADPSGT